MLTQEDFWMIQELHQQGVYQGEIAERLGGTSQDSGPRPQARGDRLPGRAAASVTPSSGRTWHNRGQASSGGRVQRRGHLPRDPGPGIRRQDSRPACLHRAQARPQGAVGPPYASRPNPAVSYSMTGVRSSSLSLVVLRESTSLSASWATRAASTSWRRLAAMPSTPTRAWYRAFAWFGGCHWGRSGSTITRPR